VLTAERVVLDEDVVALQACGTEGFFGVLAHHAPFTTTLAPGPLTLRFADGRREVLRLSGGVFEVAGNRAVVLADAVD
jgi:F-type H+-transporting ATPase subunit epsilon